MSRTGAEVAEADPFDLPEWLGEHEVTWTGESAVQGGVRVRGVLSAGDRRLDCDLLAADVAYPEPLLDEQWRTCAHRAWSHGQVGLLRVDDRLTLAVPCRELDAAVVLVAVGRLAKAVGVAPSRFLVALRPC